VDKSAARYLKSHEWAGLDGDVATVGITDFAVGQLTDLTYVELPKVGSTVTQGERFGEVESVKAVSDLYSPVTGEVVAVNESLEEDVAPLSDDPFGAGWLMKVRVADRSAFDGLLDRSTYEAHCASDAH
jgi:glycine cleavage system H protein